MTAALVHANRVQETTSTTGSATTGTNLSLAGAAAQCQTFVSGIGNGKGCYYTILSGNGTDWQDCLGTVTSGSPNTLSIDTILSSSQSGAAITLSGTSTVYTTAPAEMFGRFQLSRYQAKTANYTAVAGDQIAADTSGGAWTLTLPSSPIANDTVEAVDAMGCWSTGNLTVSGNGANIQGSSQNGVLDVDGATAIFTYINSTIGWQIAAYPRSAIQTRWNPGDIGAGVFPVALLDPNGRRVASAYGNTSVWAMMRSNRSRSSGKLYFEYKHEAIVSNAPVVGIADGSANMTNYLGSDTHGYGIDAAGTSYTNNASTAHTAYAAGDIVGVAVDFTASTGSVKFYKNNSANGSYTSLTLPAMFIAIAINPSDPIHGILRTTAQQCSYSPPSGYSCWDS